MLLILPKVTGNNKSILLPTYLPFKLSAILLLASFFWVNKFVTLNIHDNQRKDRIPEVLLKARENTNWKGFTEKEKEGYLNEVLDLINGLLQTLDDLENE